MVSMNCTSPTSTTVGEAFRDVAIEKRYELLDLMATMFRAFKLPIVIQTCSPEHLAEIPRKDGGLACAPALVQARQPRARCSAVPALRVRMFIREQSKVLPQPLSLIIDEGLQKSGNALSMSGWADLFAGGRCKHFRASSEPFSPACRFCCVRCSASAVDCLCRDQQTSRS